jgi:hypothetical protein
MAPLDRRTRNRRRGLLVVGVVVLLGLVALGVRLGCAGGDGSASGDGGGSALSGKEVQVKVGEPVKVGGAQVTVAAFTPTDRPVRPMYPIDASVPAPAGAGETFYQAFVHFESGAKGTFRYDPTDFDLLVGGTPVAEDPTYSGPVAQTLLPGATLDAVVSFRAPAGADVKLRYRPTGTGATVIFTGTRKPEGMAGRTAAATAEAPCADGATTATRCPADAGARGVS